jgi:hypothetical protein
MFKAIHSTPVMIVKLYSDPDMIPHSFVGCVAFILNCYLEEWVKGDKSIVYMKSFISIGYPILY